MRLCVGRVTTDEETLLLDGRWPWAGWMFCDKKSIGEFRSIKRKKEERSLASTSKRHEAGE
jgi:hypothetical protein